MSTPTAQATSRRRLDPRKILQILACTVAVLFLASSAGAQDETAEDADLWDYFGARPFRITASTGFDFTRGDYGSGVTSDVLYVPTSLKLELEPLVFRVTVPWVRAEGDVVLLDGETVPIEAGGARSGLGDVVLALGYVYYPSVSYLPLTEFTGKLKLGTADEKKGLGTGQTDFTMKLDVSKSFGLITPFAGGAYKIVGEPPAAQLRNKWSAYAGLVLRASRRITLGASYDWSQSSVATRPDSHEISPFATFKFGRHFAIDPYLVIGLSENAPDWGMGMQMRFIFDRY